MTPYKKETPLAKLVLSIILSTCYLAIAYKFPLFAEYNTSKTSKFNTSLELELGKIASRISLLKKVTINIPHEGELTFLTLANTLQEALIEEDIDIKDNYVINLPLNSTLLKNTYITIDEISTEIITETEAIDFNVEEISDDSIEIDETRIVQNGSLGEKKLTYEVIYKNSLKISKTLIREEITNYPQNKIIAIGTKPKQETIEGNQLTYRKKLSVYATSYDGNCFGCTGRTYTGSLVTKGVVAVDPQVIPLYTKMYIPGYGYGQALDIGGGVRGNMIDLGFANLAAVQGAWSSRYVDIYILD